MVTAVMPEEKSRHVLQTVKEYGKGLMNFIRKRVKTEEDAEDILQDVWYQFSSLINVAPVEHTGAWLYTVARNKIIDKYKKKSEELLGEGFSDDGDEEPDFRALLLTEGTTPETEYLRNLFWEQLFLALDELPEEQKQVFMWQELEGVPFQELSRQTGEKIQTLVTRKRYAVLHLRKRLRQLYKEIIIY